jgi:prepilin-type processing-associated H-X9-DG protein
MAPNLTLRDRPPPTIGPRDFQDGTSMTSAASEWLLGPALATADDALRTIYKVATPVERVEDLDRLMSACRSLDNTTSSERYNARGMFWFAAGITSTLYNHNFTPQSRSCRNPRALTDAAVPPTSLHPDGVNVLFVDGHVSFVKSTIHLSTWRALGTRSSGEVVPQLP